MTAVITTMATKRSHIRFWDYIHAPVLISIAAGQVLHHHYAYATDEGYHSEWHRWEFDGTTLKAEQGTKARDCDGVFETCSEAFFQVGQERNGYQEQTDKAPNGQLITYPLWRPGERSQRDHSAEAMGY